MPFQEQPFLTRGDPLGHSAGNIRDHRHVEKRFLMRGAPLLAVLAAWLLAVFVLVGVGGEFPLSDDWAYGHVVRTLCNGGGLDLLPWTGASLVAQAGYGAVACGWFGFSYEMLRLTTVAMSVVGIAATWMLLREAGANPRTSAAGAAVVAFSPPWFNLTFTFMTDVPFASLITLAAALYARGFRRGSRGLLLTAGIVAANAFLIRQHGVFAPMAAALVALLSAPLAQMRAHEHAPYRVGADDDAFSRFVDAASACAVPFLVIAVYTAWVASGRGVPLAMQIKVNEAATTPFLEIGNAAFRGIVTTGFLLMPWALALRPDGAIERRFFVALVAALGGAAVFLFVREGALMFYLPNVLYDFGLGAITLRDAFFLALPSLPRLGPAFTVPLTIASLVSAAMLGVALLSRVIPMLRSPVTAFCLGALGLTALGTLGQSAYYFDRYLLPVLPLAMAGVVAVSPAVRIGAGYGVAIVALALYSVAGTHDYMEWNRVRWQMLTALEARGVTAERIDGGMEYNAERLAARLRTSPSDAQARRGQAATVKSWWWVIDDEWVVAFGPLDGYEVADSRSYSRWLGMDEGRVLLLHRAGGSAEKAAGSGALSSAAASSSSAGPSGITDGAAGKTGRTDG